MEDWRFEFSNEKWRMNILGKISGVKTGDVKIDSLKMWISQKVRIKFKDSEAGTQLASPQNHVPLQSSPCAERVDGAC